MRITDHQERHSRTVGVPHATTVRSADIAVCRITGISSLHRPETRDYLKRADRDVGDKADMNVCATVPDRSFMAAPARLHLRRPFGRE